LEGPPGSGKSFLSQPIAEAARAAGTNVYVTSTSWRATDVVKEETETAGNAAKCMRAFLLRLNPRHPDAITLDSDSMVIVDEGSMIDLTSMSQLIEKANGARIVIIGDTRQLSPIGNGSPMAAILTVLPGHRLENIRRQAEQWQKETSEMFSRGQHSEAFEAYDSHGCVHWIDGREATIRRLVDDWEADLTTKPSGERLCLAYRHADVHDINDGCRAVYRAAGRLHGPDFELRAIGRGRRAVPAGIRLASGDRVIFGETLEVNGIAVRNSDMGTVEAITGSPKNPLLRIRLDKGVSIEAEWSAFVGKRPHDCGENYRVPKVQNSFCVSIHSSQGLTIGSGNPDNRVHGSTFVYNSGLGAQSSLVAMTRHVDDCHVYVETSRVRDRIICRKSSRGVVVDGRGRLEAPDAEDAGVIETAIIDDDIKAEVLKEVATSEIKRNCVDFVNNVHDWLNGREKLGTVSEDIRSVSVKAADRTEISSNAVISDGSIKQQRGRYRRNAISI